MDFKTLKSTMIEYYPKNFLEVARKTVEDKEFLTISKGYINQDGNKRYKGGIGIPLKDDIPNKIIDAIKEMSE